LGIVPAVFLWSVGWVFERITKREGMGLGDVKLLAVLGLATGLLPCMTILVLASVQGAVAGVILNLFGGHTESADANTEHTSDDDWVPPVGAFPFGPFLVLATLQCLFFPQSFGSILTHLNHLLVGHA